MPLSSPSPEPSPPFCGERILVVPLRYIGDTILTVPLLRNLRRHCPDARIDLLTSASAAPLMEPCPYVDRVLIEPLTLRERFRLLRNAGNGSYQRIFILRKSVTLAAMAALAGIPDRVGYDKQRFPFGYRRWGWFLTHRAIYPGLKTDTPQAVSHLKLLHAYGIPTTDDHLELWSTPADERAVDSLLTRHDIPVGTPLAALHAASASHGKQIDLDKFVESVRTLIQRGYRVLATGTREDAPGYAAFCQRHGLPLENLAGETSLRETFALYKRIDVLLTVDSSPIHLAAAAGTPRIVGVFGPTNERQWGPHNAASHFTPVHLDLPCRPCYAKTCVHNNCRELLTGGQIARALFEVSPTETPLP
jgi:heptosyltransferase-2